MKRKIIRFPRQLYSIFQFWTKVDSRSKWKFDMKLIAEANFIRYSRPSKSTILLTQNKHEQTRKIKFTAGPEICRHVTWRSVFSTSPVSSCPVVGGKPLSGVHGKCAAYDAKGSGYSNSDRPDLVFAPGPIFGSWVARPQGLSSGILTGDSFPIIPCHFVSFRFHKMKWNTK